MNPDLFRQLENPLLRKRHLADRDALLRLFPELSVVRTGRFLGLRPFLYEVPERFFNRTLHQAFFKWLVHRDLIQRQELRQALADAEPLLNRAILFLRESNQEPWHDDLIEATDDFETLRVIDRDFHRVYLRLIEAVLTPFARLVAHFSRRDREAGTSGLDIWNISQELRGGEMQDMVRSYRAVVRNGLGHGDVQFMLNEVGYRDKAGCASSVFCRGLSLNSGAPGGVTLPLQWRLA